MGLLNLPGNFISSVGTTLGLPDLGIGKAIGGDLSLPGALQGTDPTLYQGVAGVNNSSNPIQNLSPTQVAALGQPTAPDPTGATTGTSGGLSAADAAAKAANDAYWQQQGGLVDDQLGRLGNQANIGHSNILDAYNSAFNALTNNKSTSERDYNTTRDQTQQDNVLAKNNIDTGVRTQLTGLQRLLGSRGAGNSSASTIAAPVAAGRMGAAQRGQVQSAYDRNIGALDTGWGDTLNQFTNAFGQLMSDRTNKDRSLDANLDTTRSGLLGQKNLIAARLGQAMDPAVADQIKALGAQVDNLGRTDTFNTPVVNAKPVDLASYNYDKFNAPALGSNVDPSLANNVGAFWTLLQGKDKQKANPVGV